MTSSTTPENYYQLLDGAAEKAKVFSQQAFVLHPLPLLNISDYYTRSTNTAKPLVGGLLGVRNYKQVTVFVSFELLLEDGKVSEDYLKKKLELYSQTFPQYELVGWFHVLPKGLMQPVQLSLSIHEQLAEILGTTPALLIVGPQDIVLKNSSAKSTSLTSTKKNRRRHSQISSDSDLRMEELEDDVDTELNIDTETSRADTDLPLAAFEPVTKDRRLEFLSMGPVQIETSEAERIAVDDVVKGAKDSESVDLSDSLGNQQGAIRMFHQRLRVVRDYILTVQAAQQQQQAQSQGSSVPLAVGRELDATDYNHIRKINAFVSELTRQREQKLDSVIQKQERDAVMAALLATVTKAEFTKLDTNSVWAAHRSFGSNSA